jgi:hypothetical protein
MGMGAHAYLHDDDTGACARRGCGKPRANQAHLEPLPVAPYAGTIGWSGTETSRQRAITEVANGKARARQQAILTHLAAQAALGATSHEVEKALGLHHGVVSGALSGMHKADRVALLTETRNGGAVYVLPQYVDGRDTQRQGRAAPRITDAEARAAASIESALLTGQLVSSTDVHTLLLAIRRLS